MSELTSLQVRDKINEELAAANAILDLIMVATGEQTNPNFTINSNTLREATYCAQRHVISAIELVK